MSKALQTLKKYYFEDQYRREVRDLLRNGVETDNRTGTPALSRSAPAHFKIELFREGIPALRGKKVFIDKALAEAYWIMQGGMYLTYLHKHGVRYWDMFADNSKSIGRSYGHRFRNLNRHDQFLEAAVKLQNEPNSRQVVMSFWDPARDSMVTPCYLSFHFVIFDGKLDMHVTQRSGDIFLGVPTDAVIFSIIAGVMATYLEIPVGTLYYTVNDIHLYSNHVTQARQFLHKGTKWYDLHEYVPATPSLKLLKWFTSPSSTIDNLIGNVEAFGLHESYPLFSLYRSLPYIKAELSK